MFGMRYEFNALSVVPAFFVAVAFFLVFFYCYIVDCITTSRFWILRVDTYGFFDNMCVFGWSLSDLIKIVIMWHCSIEPIGIWKPLSLPNSASLIRNAIFDVYMYSIYTMYRFTHCLHPYAWTPFAIVFQFDYVLMVAIKNVICLVY